MYMHQVLAPRQLAFRAASAHPRGIGRLRSLTIRAHLERRRTVIAAPLALIPWLDLHGRAQAVASETPAATKDTGTQQLWGYSIPRVKYPDFIATPSGLQYKDFREGTGEQPQAGDTVVLDWAGYTIGYYGRPFEARNKPKGGTFTGDDKDYVRFVLGRGALIPAFEEALSSMREGGLRRIVVPEELGYPASNWRKLGPQPKTFTGERALGFVLENKGMIDKTLLFDIELRRVIKG